MIIGYPFSEEKFWAKYELFWLGFSIDISAKKYGIFEVKRRFTLAKVQLLSKLKNPSLNQARSVAGPPQWASQMCPWLRPFLAGLYAFFENRSEFGKNWQKLSITGKKYGGFS